MELAVFSSNVLMSRADQAEQRTGVRVVVHVLGVLVCPPQMPPMS
jgi:hypothetical protein